MEIFIKILMFLPLLCATPIFALSYNYETFLAEAIKKSPDLKIAQRKYLGSKINVDLVTLQDSYALMLSSSLSAFHDQSYPKDDWLQKDQKAGLQLNVPVYDFGRQSSKENIAAKELDVSFFEQKDTLNRFQAEAARMFAAAIYNQSVYNKAKSQFAIAKEKLQQIANNFHQGLRPESDFIAAQIDFTRAEFTFSKADKEFVLIMKDLKYLVGMDSSKNISFSLDYDDLMPDEIYARSDSFSQELVKNHPLIQMNYQRIEASKMALFSSEIDKMPVIKSAFKVSEGGDFSESLISPIYLRYEAQLLLNWDIPVNNRNNQEQIQLQNNMQILILENQKLQDDLLQKFHLIKVRLGNSLADQKLIKKQMELSRKNLDLVGKKYQNGNSSSLEYSVAELQFVGFELQELELLYQSRLLAINLFELVSSDQWPVLFKR